jgi:L-asparagine transporter-like permease
MSITGLFATAGATNAGLYPAAGLCEHMASIGQFPPGLGRTIGNRVPMGLVVTAAIAMVLAVGFDLSAIASIGSAVALLVFTMVSIGHLRVRGETGARVGLIIAAIASTSIVLLAFALTTLIDEPGTAIALIVIVGAGVVADLVWKRRAPTPLRSGG